MVTFFTVLGNFLTIALAVALACLGCEGGVSLFTGGRAGCFYYLMLRYFHTNFQKSFPTWLRPPWLQAAPTAASTSLCVMAIDNATRMCYTIRVR